MKLMWLAYLVYSFGNCVIKLYIETDLNNATTLATRANTCLIKGCQIVDPIFLAEKYSYKVV